METGKLEKTGSRITEWFSSNARRLYNVMREKVDMCNDVARNNWVARKKTIWNDVNGHVLKDLEELDRVYNKEIEDITGLWQVVPERFRTTRRRRREWLGLYSTSISKFKNSSIDLSRNLGLSDRTRAQRVIVNLPSRKMCVGSKWVLLLDFSSDSLYT